MTTTEQPMERLTPAELSRFFLFEKLNAEQLSWMSEHGEVVRYPAGATVFDADEPATCFYMLVEGHQAMLRRVGDHEVEVSRSERPGVYTGATWAWLASATEASRQSQYAASLRTLAPSTFFRIPADELAQALSEWFPMAIHLLDGLFTGLRTSDAVVGQRERLTALGRLTAGLTHELNNPASAAVRATATLRERVAAMRGKLKHLASGKVDPDTLVKLTGLQEDAIEQSAKAKSGKTKHLTPMQANDLEDEFSDWCEDHGVSSAWQLAPVWVAAGLDLEWLEGLSDSIPKTHLEAGLKWITYALESEQLMAEIEDATDRIATLINAAKQYSQMDRAEHQQVDVHEGLNSTLIMLGGKVRAGIKLEKTYDKSLPAIPAYPAELNQVWTNLIDNAIHAMNDRPERKLSITTGSAGDFALVTISDTGPGMSPEIQRRIFEPFFTTKPIGEGTGLGLDIVWRIVVNRHGGDIKVISVPGEGTTFEVRLPLTAPRSS
ncbi:ATP-binding protein [Kineosporia sp. NBRC 101731]|uniref:sensor histidine kinase n=1 Tax=Kineosporia sp. NBRC 101731 TaxID=3032199 RepID=UPI0024A3FADF|nr:ATP-binding protein [Kineosporia sp. NBRC 101731]GLY27308.1 histidine kinase [Kineosporia sp. NBRC 101731]